MAVDIFLKLAGIPGESQDAHHKGEIEVVAWSWGLSERAEGQTGGGGGAGKPMIEDLSVQKLVDLASPLLLAAAARGNRISDAALTVRKAAQVPQEFLVISIKNVLITSVKMQEATTQDRPEESITLSFGQIKFDYTQFKADGTKGQQESFSWDVATNTGA